MKVLMVAEGMVKALLVDQLPLSQSAVRSSSTSSAFIMRSITISAFIAVALVSFVALKALMMAEGMVKAAEGLVMKALEASSSAALREGPK